MSDHDNIRPLFEDGHTPGRSKRAPKHAPPTADPWELDDGSNYSLDKFYVASQDKDKNTVNVQVNIPQSLSTQMDQWLQSGKIKHYRTKQDICRDALIHRFYYLQNEMFPDPNLESILRSMLAQSDLATKIREAEEQSEYVAFITKSLERASATKDASLIAVTLKMAEEKVELLREPYKGRLVESLDMYGKRS